MNKPNQRVLILCEGVTEYYYAKAMQMELPRQAQRSIAIEIEQGMPNDPKNLALEAKRKKEKALREKNPYDSIWLFFDHDNRPQLKDAFEIIHREGFVIAYSAICIEHWFLLHFEQCGKSFLKGEEALRQLKRYWPEYHKTKLNHYHELRDKLPVAVNRSLQLRKIIRSEEPAHEKNPFFTINELVVFFQNLAG